MGDLVGNVVGFLDGFADGELLGMEVGLRDGFLEGLGVGGVGDLDGLVGFLCCVFVYVFCWGTISDNQLHAFHYLL